MPWGEKHGAWLGDAADDHTKRQRARRLFPVGPCERCGSDGRTERHHIDGNPGNNIAANIAILCRSCHQDVDGRTQSNTARLVAIAKANVKPLAPCANCGRLYKPLRLGRCGPCSIHWRKFGDELDVSKIRKRTLTAASSDPTTSRETK